MVTCKIGCQKQVKKVRRNGCICSILPERRLVGAEHVKLSLNRTGSHDYTWREHDALPSPIVPASRLLRLTALWMLPSSIPYVMPVLYKIMVSEMSWV